MHLEVLLKLKNLKNSIFWANISKKPKKIQKTQKKQQKNTGLGLF